MHTARAMGGCHKPGPKIISCPISGLWCAGVILHVSGRHIATWLVGQVRDADMDIGEARKCSDGLNVDKETFIQALEEVPTMTFDRFSSIARFLFLSVNQLSEKACLAVENARLFEDLKKELDRRMDLEKDKRHLETMLLRSQKMEAIGTLAGGIAHDFNNILFPIIGFSEMILEDLPENSLLREQMEYILKGAFRARDLVEQILTFSRQTEYDYHPVQIQLILRQVLDKVRPLLPAGVKIRDTVSENVGRIMADSKKIRQMVMNLLTNAMDAMEKTGGELWVGLSEIEAKESGSPGSDLPPGTYACLKIADTGKGIKEADRERIFEPYFTTKNMEKGTGLGLSVVHGIVKKLRGKIVVNSQAGKGTEFLIYLPQILPGKEAGMMMPQPLPLSIPGKNCAILIIDNDESILKLLDVILSGFGCKTTCLDSSLNAMERFAQSPDAFDLVITDMDMPGLTGEDLISGMKKTRPDIPMILCAGIDALLTKNMSPKPDKILRKPFTKNQLIETILVLTGKRPVDDNTDKSE